jgi:hypothetical protein
MKLSHALLTAVAVGGIAAPMTSALAAPAKRHHLHHATGETGTEANAEMRQELAELRAEVSSLHQELTAQKAAKASTQTAVADTSAQVGAIHDQIAATPPVSKAEVQTQIASAIEKEHKKPYAEFKGIHITPGGFLEMAGIYRSRYEGADMASSFAIPFPNSHTGQVSEGRFSARQSRLSFLAQGKPSKDTTLSMYGEFDFLGGAQTANSNQSNSFNPRVRHLYATIDWERGDTGIHLLAGQTWSLVTMNTKGITPRNELTPPQIDAQYVPGFVWSRQPQVRLTGDFLDHHLWLAVSAENAATTTYGTIPTAVITATSPAGSGFDSANTLSLNGTPDFVGKAAYEGTIAGRSLHLEGFALSRTFTAHINGGGNINKAGYGFGGGIVLQAIPHYLDLQFSGMGGKGIGRYGTSGLPDVAFASDGSIHPIKEFMLLAGATAHPNKMLDVYVFAGKEQESRQDLGGGYGIGLTSANNSGCFVEGGTCAGASHRIQQLTAGFWQKIYSGNFGRAQVGMQYSYTQRELFEGVGGAPQTGESMGFFSIRYYPF